VAGHTHHRNRAIRRRDLSETGDARVSDLGRVPVGEPQYFDTLTVSCRGCGRSIPPGEVFTRHPVPDDRRVDLTAPFCQTCRPFTASVREIVGEMPTYTATVAETFLETAAETGDGTSTQDLISALRRGLERQARTESGSEV
jgi:hypothetical protein